MQFISLKWIGDDDTPFSALIVLAFLVLVTGTFIFYLFLLGGSYIFGVPVTELLLSPGERQMADPWEVRYLQVAQQLSYFFFPAVAMILIYRKSPLSLRLVYRKSGFIELFLVIILAFFTMYITIWTGILNSGLEMPESLSGVEQWMKEKEEEAAGVTGLLLKSESGIDYLFLLIVIAFIPAVCEELVFRGVLQQIAGKFLRSENLAVWITAIIFSAIHLQFYGFLPRLILGLIFGYLFLWTGNILIPVAAHFLNNFIVTLLSLSEKLPGISKEAASEQTDNLSGFPFIPVIIVLAIMYFFRRKYRKRDTLIRYD